MVIVTLSELTLRVERSLLSSYYICQTTRLSDRQYAANFLLVSGSCLLKKILTPRSVRLSFMRLQSTIVPLHQLETISKSQLRRQLGRHVPSSYHLFTVDNGGSTQRMDYTTIELCNNVEWLECQLSWRAYSDPLRMISRLA